MDIRDMIGLGSDFQNLYPITSGSGMDNDFDFKFGYG
jgi:hypothetical protein